MEILEQTFYLRMFTTRKNVVFWKLFRKNILGDRWFLGTETRQGTESMH